MILQQIEKFRFTILVTVATLVCSIVPEIASSWTLSFGQVADGEWWRLWTGHCTHYGASHLFWDLLMFILLAGVCEQRYPRQFPLVLLAIMGSLGFAVWWWCPEVGQYRGLSGVDTGLFLWFIGDRIYSSWTTRPSLEVGAWAFLAIALLGKLGYEAATGQTMFVDASDFQPLVESHLAGAFGGAVFGIAGTAWSIRQEGTRASASRAM